MRNYIRSERYRILHGKGIYVFTGVLAGLAVLINLTLSVFSGDGFPYAITRFPISFLLSGLTVLLMAGMAAADVLFGDEYKNGTLKNVVSYGISRTEFFIGKCLVTAVMALVSMVIVLACFIGSAYLLLEHTDPQLTITTLKGILINLPAAFAALILGVALLCICKKELYAVGCWFTVYWVIPYILFLLGFRFPIFRKIAGWCPWIYLSGEAEATFSHYSALWETPQGMAKCLIAGFVGILIFFVTGVAAFRKREIV